VTFSFTALLIPSIHFFEQCAKYYPLVLPMQCGSDLGDKMLNAFSDALSQYCHAILIGCDCPSLTVDDLQEVLTTLQSDQHAVIAPAEDGGYVLVMGQICNFLV
jgi:glycosyltransferase A (GT-A) superfamily protein (DUF2064 family)